MFGKPDWFKKKRIGWGITPICWQGWSYTAAWIGVLVVPFLLLVGQHLMAESLLWLAAAMGTLVWDVRQILIAMGPVAEDDVLYIDETETLSEQFATRNFDFRLRG
ncbi:MAG TPA: hypothetical protein VMM76_04455 [Pirellulaceae bacterium]|nr:hypothetical protein [Pirellulaceae bacterium]